ncbi:Acetyltransferase (GNAT) family protein [Geodermatophilus telluris]|uniref:Acetyltransferase (GNAT) family protein n=1 Tax=Geodermatophilus telluris TaxID=1190417 RepID=A0A1G6TN89_9ACTN|nr:GNAT family N-acetyltransferase [Geodermatophilus telluris]SDD30499.1 Acetyltransferase (GNAT) family protein [Geodermatophilus telluris]
MTEDVQHSVRPARAADADSLTRTLASAFADDPLFCHLLPPGVRRRHERLRRALAVDAARSLSLGGLWTTAHGDAAAVWFPPGAWRGTARQDLAELPAWLRAGGRRMRAFQQVRAALYAHHRDLPPHAYLLYLGTRPGRQSQGLGSALLRAVLDRCDAERLPAYLEATCARNVPLYRRHGFVAHDAVEPAGGCPPLTPMWRDPR